MSDATTIPVEIHIAEITPTHGTGKLVATATIVMALNLDGGYQLQLPLSGCQIRIVEGRWCARGPSWRDPASGQLRDQFRDWPRELTSAIGRELLAAWEEHRQAAA